MDGFVAIAFKSPDAKKNVPSEHQFLRTITKTRYYCQL
jgi:hypothetical protein